MMTEEDALRKWCPYAMSASDDYEYSANRFTDGNPDTGARCIASKCMAWRWNEATATSRRGLGYCGLAGKP